MKKRNYKQAWILSVALISGCAQLPEQSAPAKAECSSYQMPSPETLQAVEPNFRQRLEKALSDFEKLLYESEVKPTK